ncbi:MAG: COX15/CtaA family protein [Planctomycetota bacterium]|nr:COX15/CtaA family protein [Planctomycetota bacterium]
MASTITALSEDSTSSAVSTGRRRFSLLLLGATLFLIFAGAEVKSREAGLSVPDWPLSYGMLMPPMVGNVFYEHGHRMVATLVGALSLVLALWTQKTESRRWIRRLAWLIFTAVCLQGALGGITVKYLLPTPVSMGHGILAQTILCAMAVLVVASGQEWNGVAGADSEGNPARARALRAVLLAVAVIWIQLALGAWVRHTESGLAVPFFPISESGAWIPEFTNDRVVTHMIHRGFALVVTVTVLWASLKSFRLGGSMRNHALALPLLLIGQIALGGAVVWTASRDAAGVLVKAPIPASLHVLNGALLLVVSWSLSLRLWRECWRTGRVESDEGLHHLGQEAR